MRKRSQFLLVQQKGRRFSGPKLVVYAQQRVEAMPVDCSRLGITVSKKVGNSVVRNQVKRWIRESFRRIPRLPTVPWDWVVIAKPAAAKVGFIAIDNELRGIIRRTGCT
jgi:ribonuclease P protein component